MSPTVCDTNTDLCVTSEPTENTGKNGSTPIWSVCVTGVGGNAKRLPSCVCDTRAQHQAARAAARSDAQTRVRACGVRR